MQSTEVTQKQMATFRMKVAEMLKELIAADFGCDEDLLVSNIKVSGTLEVRKRKRN